MLPHARHASRRVVVGYVWWCCGLVYVIACEWWQGCMAWQAPCSRIELSGVLPINVVSSVAWTQFGSLCCIPASKALVPLVDSFLVGAPCGASAGPWSRPRVPRVPRGLRVATVDHVGVLVASDAEHHVGLGPSAPFANVPSECHCCAPHDHRARPRPSLPSGEPGPLGKNKRAWMIYTFYFSSVQFELDYMAHWTMKIIKELHVLKLFIIYKAPCYRSTADGS